jgi:hypothetical protein
MEFGADCWKGMFVYISKKVIRNEGRRGRLLNRIVVAKIAMSTGADAYQSEKSQP